MDWTDEDREWLKECYSLIGPRLCAYALKRSESGIRAEASRLKLKKSITKTNEQFLLDLSERNINVIPLDKYINGDTKIRFKCPEEHEFFQRPRTILERSGKCPICSSSGFKESEPASLYLVELDIDGEPVYKLGITNRNVIQRLGSDFRKFKGSICWTVEFPNGLQARQLESHLKRENADFQYNTGMLTSGNTETFSCYINKPEI